MLEVLRCFFFITPDHFWLRVKNTSNTPFDLFITINVFNINMSFYCLFHCYETTKHICVEILLLFVVVIARAATLRVGSAWQHHSLQQIDIIRNHSGAWLLRVLRQTMKAFHMVFYALNIDLVRWTFAKAECNFSGTGRVYNKRECFLSIADRRWRLKRERES